MYCVVAGRRSGRPRSAVKVSTNVRQLTIESRFNACGVTTAIDHEQIATSTSD
jgi:hypothetical protein